MKLAAAPATKTLVNPLVTNSLRASAVGWAGAGIGFTQDYAFAAEQVFGFPVDPDVTSGGAFNTDFSLAYVAFSTYLEFIDVAILLLLSSYFLLNNAKNTQRLVAGTTMKHVCALVAFAIGTANGYEGGPLLPAYLALELFTTVALVARSEVDSFGEAVSSASKDFASALDLQRITSDSLLANFYRLGFFSSLIVGASFAFSPVSPIAPVDDGETLISKILRGEYGCSLLFLLPPVSLIQSEAVSSKTLGAASSRVLNLAYSALVAVSGYFTLLGRSRQVGKTEVQAFEEVDRWSTNTQAAGTLAVAFALFYLLQAILATSEETNSE